MCFACLVVGMASAQGGDFVGKWSLIPRLGVNIAKLSNHSLYVNDNEVIKPKTRASLMGGIDVEYRATDRWAFSLGAFYSQQGSRYKSFEMTGDGAADYYGYHDMYTRLQYMQVPVQARFYLAEGLSVQAGVQVGFLLDAVDHCEATRIVQGEGDSYYYEEEEPYEEEMPCKKVDVSIPIGLSYEYMNVVLTAKYHIPLTKVDDYPNYKEDAKNKVFSLSVGYRFTL